MDNEQTSPDKKVDNRWHVNKSVSISVIVLLLINWGSTIWWASAMSSDIALLKERKDLEPRVIRLEVNGMYTGRLLEKIDETLERLNTTITEIAKEQNKRTGLVYDKYKDKK